MNVVVGQPPIRPNRCAVLPQLVNLGLDPEARYVDTYQDIWDDRIYVSETAVKEMAKLLGHPTTETHQLAVAELESLRAQNEDLRLQLREADEELNGISHLKARGYQPVKRVGRPPAKKAA